jgi:hypothetical protein
MCAHIDLGHDPEVPVEGGTGRAVVSPTASTLRDEMAVSGQRLLGASGQIRWAAHNRASHPDRAPPVHRCCPRMP